MVPQILLVDDDRIFLTMLAKRLSQEGWQVSTAETAGDGLEKIRKHKPEILLLDVFLPDRSGVEAVGEVKALAPDLPVIMVSTSGETKNIVAAIKNGASDYVKKPVDEALLTVKIQHLLDVLTLKRTQTEFRENAELKRLIGESPAIKKLIREISKVANSDATVLLSGETGTGKGLVAEIIHGLSRRRNQRFIAINCAAIPATLLESELFGHERGAFTGAIREKKGIFELADQGTIFLDEIGEIAPELQVKLLRVLQGQEFERVGGTKSVKVDVRVIAATNRNLEDAIAQGHFREDLFYRLNVLPVTVPPLRDRKEDIPLLLEHFIRQFGDKAEKRFEKLSPEIVETLSAYSWPGNVRELQNVVERAVVFGKEPRLAVTDFNVNPPRPAPAAGSDNGGGISSLKELEQQLLLQALRQSGGNVSRAARTLGISRGTVYRRLERYEIGLKK
ncbi:MAG TPA: sigma-54 dependent transcriptional regulator [bacterium]|nr:sigma-54 dependent transcriptional regulator [bacterium]